MLGDLIGAIPALARSARSISFSQYGEDVLLSVSLLPGSSGFYVDVGAYHPWRGSNTYKLYLKGWSGLTIEPNPASAAEFRRLRPRDVHIVAGVAAERSELTYHQFADAKLNTFAADQAAIYVNEGAAQLGANPVPCRPLQEIIDEHARGRRLDLLSVDCEGFDLVALQTLDFTRNRPTAILVEDFDAFQRLREGSGLSPIAAWLRDLDYQTIGQVMFSTLYVDRAAVAARASNAFRLTSIQFS